MDDEVDDELDEFEHGDKRPADPQSKRAADVTNEDDVLSTDTLRDTSGSDTGEDLNDTACQRCAQYMPTSYVFFATRTWEFLERWSTYPVRVSVDAGVRTLYE